MDRVFLDANVLLSAAWRPGAAVRRLWTLENVELLSPEYAVAEARRNLETPAQRGRLTRLLSRVHMAEVEHFTLPRGIRLPEKDMPILLAAIDAGATHLLTGDWEHFGPYFRRDIAGVLVLPPAEYQPIVHDQEPHPAQGSD